MDIAALIVIVVILGIFAGVGGVLLRAVGWEESLTMLTRPRGTPTVRGLPANGRAAIAETPQTALDARLTALERNQATLRQSVEQTRQDFQERQAIALRELRDEVRGAATDAPVRVRHQERRDQAVAALYAELARVEAAIATVINPVLLPGERVSVPDEFLAETLSWDNWKDVGERAFALGDTFNQERLYLDADTARAAETCISTLRTALTNSVYPNVRDHRPTSGQLANLRAGLDQIVHALPTLRAEMEAGYRSHAAAGRS